MKIRILFIVATVVGALDVLLAIAAIVLVA